MFARRARGGACVLAALALMPAAGTADDASSTKVAESAPESSADTDLLEYLGSVDAEGQDWMDYLARTDIAQVVKAKKAPATTEVDDK
jgi:hypothetical protein